MEKSVITTVKSGNSYTAVHHIVLSRFFTSHLAPDAMPDNVSTDRARPVLRPVKRPLARSPLATFSEPSSR